MAQVPRGGPATINGVLYQMIWSLLRTSRLRILDCKQAPGGNAIAQAVLVLEPSGGGGDLRLSGPDGVIVEQVKARPGGRPWSLREVVESVLPDLFLAIDLSNPNRCYRFVTEGQIGDWPHVYGFFRSLGTRVCPDHGVLTALNGATELPFRRMRRAGRSTTNPYWHDERYTERTLFQHISQRLLRQPRIARAESADSVRRKLWHLLSRFEFDGDRTVDQLRKQVDRQLLDLIDLGEQVPEKRDAMLVGLARRAAQGDAHIDRQTFLASYLLDSTPLSNWQNLLHQGAEYLRSRLELRGYDSNGDVRRKRYPAAAEEWPARKPILLLAGESGQGKSWFLYGLGSYLTERNELCVFVPAGENLDETLQKAADAFWRDIKGNDGHLPLPRIAARRREVFQAYADRWLTLLIDGVQDVPQARELAVQPWQTWGIRVAISCSGSVAKTIEAEARGRGTTVGVHDFTTEELQEYLWRAFGDDWTDIPLDVRETLRRPLLASIYNTVAPKAHWRPANEYEFYSRYWEQRLHEDGQADFPLDAAGLSKAACSVLDGKPYPWPAVLLRQAGLDNEAIVRLCSVGWLRPTEGERFEIWHDRLLNWAVAQGLVGAVEHGEISSDQLCERVQKLYGGHETYAGRFLGYMPMDVVWLLAHRNATDPQLLSGLVKALEDTPWPRPENLYKHLLPTIGSAILPTLFDRLVAVAEGDDAVLLRRVVEAVSSLESDPISRRARDLLDDDSPFVQRAAMSILARRPCSQVLNRLWELHCTIMATPDRFLRQHESSYDAYDDSFEALQACVRLTPFWLEATITRADPSTQPVKSLAWLLAGLPGESELWSRCKHILFKKIPPPQERCLGANIYAHRDESELDWLLRRIDREDNLVGAMAMRALIRIAPDVALDQLSRLPKRELGPTRKWCVAELLDKRTDATRARLLEILQQEEDPWQVALAYQDDEDAMDVATLDFLLDSLERLLDRALASPSDSEEPSLYIPLKMLANIHRLELLDCFGRRQGTDLEEKLTEWLLMLGPQQGRYEDSPERGPAIDLLHRIGGSGFTRVVNSWLKADDRYGRLEGLTRAAKRADAETVALLAQISQREELWEGHPTEQRLATGALAALGEWDHVIDSILRWGLQTSGRVASQRQISRPINDRALQAVFGLIATGSPTPGAMLALGISARSDLVGRIHDVTQRAAPDSELMLACVLALDRLGDRSERVEKLFVSQLGINKHRHAATVGLLHIGSATALQALTVRIEDTYDDLIVANLALRDETREAAARSVWAELHRSPRSIMADTHIACLGCLREQEVRDYLRRIAFDTDRASFSVGHRARAIRGLGQFDPESAFLAAKKALEDTTGRDRAQYPYVLLELDREQAIPILMAQLVDEADPAIIAAIGRALQDADLYTTLAEWFASSDEALRVTACRLAGWMRPDSNLSGLLRGCLDGPGDRLSSSARKALARLRATEEADHLVAALHSEEDDSRRWILLDAILAVADPGDTDQRWPAWARDIAEALPRCMQLYLAEELQRRRKQLAKEQHSVAGWTR